MSLFDNKYPYTDFHELNLDWILEEIKKFSTNLDTLEERVKAASIEASREYVDTLMAQIRSEFNALTVRVNQLSNQFDSTVRELEGDYADFIRLVQLQIDVLQRRIEQFDATIKADIIGVNARTDYAIAQNNELIFAYIDRGFFTLKVIDPFTGNPVTIQNMINILASYHLANAVTYEQLAGKNLTYAEFAAYNMTYYELLTDGKNILGIN